MKATSFFLSLMFFALNGIAQQKVHSHNDYVQSRPLLEAYEARAEQIEADIFLRGDSLIVAHSKKEIIKGQTLNKLYLDPIAKLFNQNQGSVSGDKNYTFSLMIDVKENWAAIYPVLQREIEKYGEVFNRTKNQFAIQIVISGARPPETTFHTYPKWMFFDGLPNISYAKKDLKRVTMISDNFATYSKWKGSGILATEDRNKLVAIANKAKEMKKPTRFWGAPDTEESWLIQVSLGATIINTDQVRKVKHFLTTINH